MKNLIKVIEHLSRAAIGLTFFILIIMVLLQLVGRTGLTPSYVWTEEAARFGLFFIAAFGTGLALKSGDLVNVDLFCEYLPRRWPWVLRFVCAILMFVITVILIIPTWKFVKIGAIQTAPALGMRMDIIHASILILIISLALFSLFRMIGMLSGIEDGKAIKTEDII